MILAGAISSILRNKKAFAPKGSFFLPHVSFKFNNFYNLFKLAFFSTSIVK